MFGRLGALGKIGSLGAGESGASADDTAVTISQIAAVTAKTNATAIVGFSQVAGIQIETDPAAEFNAVAAVTAAGKAGYVGAPAVSNIAAVTASGAAGYTASVAVSSIAATSIERTVGYSWTNAEGETFETNASETGWDDGLRGDIDQLISDLKSGQVNSSNVWSGMDRILLMDLPNSADSLRYLNAPTLTATAVNSPTFAATEGFTGDGSTSDIDTNFNPSTDGVNYTQNSASVGVWVRDVGSNGFGYYTGLTVSSAAAAIGRNTDASPWIVFGPSGGANNNETTLSSAASGLLGANRSGSAAIECYVDGVLDGSDTDASWALADTTFAILARNDDGTSFAHSDGQVSAWFAGRSFTANEWADISDAFNRYRTAREAA